MKGRTLKSLLAGATALALLLTCMLAGLVLPASAANEGAGAAVSVGQELLNNDFSDASDKCWKSLYGTVVNYAAGEGKNGTQALRIDRNYPVYQTFSGLKPSTTYIMQGGAKLSADESCLVITVTNGNTVVARLEEQYVASTWDQVNKDGGETSSQFSGGYTFTTPATLQSNTTVIYVAVKKNAEDTADTCGTPEDAATSAGGGLAEEGEGEVTDNDDDLSLIGVYYAYLNNISLNEKVEAKVDLTPTDVQWDGDADNDGQVMPGTPITFKVPVKNVGEEDLVPGQSFTIDISAGGEVIRTFSYNGGIKAGETVLVTDTVAWEAQAGDHMIAARVNADEALYETNLKTNQTYQLNLRVANGVYSPAFNGEEIAKAGMDKLTLSDDFNDLSTIDTQAGGAEGYKWYVTRPWGDSTLTTDDYAVQNGIITLKTKKTKYNITLNSVDVYTNNGFRYKHGYLEVRLRVVTPAVDKANGIPAIWSFTENKALEEKIYGTAQLWTEMDWLEYWGVESGYANGHYTTTFHHSVEKTLEATQPEYSCSNKNLSGLGDEQWHVMGWLWENNSFRAFLDGKEVQRVLFDPDASAVPPPTLGSAAGCANASSDDPGVFGVANIEKAVLYLSGSEAHPMEVDYVRIWQQSESNEVTDAMEMDRTELTMAEGSLERLTVSVPNGEDGGTLSWKSSDPSVVTVHGNGELYARTTGKAVVTATNANGISVMCTVTVRHNLISGGDFEFNMTEGNNEDILFQHWKNVSYSAADASKAYITTDTSNTSGNRVLAVLNSGLNYANMNSLQRGKEYELTGKYKNGLTMYVSFKHGITSFTHYSQTGSKTVTGSEKDSASCSIQRMGTTADGWNLFKVRFTIAEEDETPTGGWNRNYLVPTFMASGTRAYVDDLVLTEVDDVRKDAYTVTANSASNGTVTLRYADTDAAIANGTAIVPGTKVEVVAEPNSGYQLQLGSLEYTYTQATLKGGKTETRKVLNKNCYDYNDDDWFGAGDGTVFYFEMPENDITLNAVFESKSSAEQKPVATLGTSVYENSETNAISGVRFLNRLYYTRMEGNDLYVMYGGSEVKVKQCGTLLKREASVLELTLESYEQNKNGSGNSRIWKTSAYNGGNIGAVDYTSTYIDFASVMTSSVANRYSFLDRGYAVRAYLVLDDGENTTFYTDIFTDSVLDAQARR